MHSSLGVCKIRNSPVAPCSGAPRRSPLGTGPSDLLVPEIRSTTRSKGTRLVPEAIEVGLVVQDKTGPVRDFFCFAGRPGVRRARSRRDRSGHRACADVRDPRARPHPPGGTRAEGRSQRLAADGDKRRSHCVSIRPGASARDEPDALGASDPSGCHWTWRRGIWRTIPECMTSCVSSAIRGSSAVMRICAFSVSGMGSPSLPSRRPPANLLETRIPRYDGVCGQRPRRPSGRCVVAAAGDCEPFDEDPQPSVPWSIRQSSPDPAADPKRPSNVADAGRHKDGLVLVSEPPPCAPSPGLRS